ncbi:MAG: hypothetical protein ABJB01_06135 [Rudaea sp.]
MRRVVVFTVLFFLAVSSSHRAAACSACGCTLNSDWASQGLAASGGWRFDVRDDYFDQNQLRSGTDKVSKSRLGIPNDEEIQQYTYNRNVTASVDYSPNRNWGINVSVPWFDRSHATIAEGDSDISTAHDKGIGDVRVTARYSGFDPQRTTGVMFGLKLPTGDSSDRFETGPAAGMIDDRGLQLGTGTTDLLVGVYHFGAFSETWSYFGQAIAQQPLTSDNGFRPGTGLNLNAGVRYSATSNFVPQLQINARVEKRESGVNGDVENSGATLLYLSPGVTWTPNSHVSLFAFFQAPIYQRVNGLQLEATQFFSVGAHYHF